MDADKIRELLEQVRTGGVDVDNAMTRLKHMPFEDLGFAKVDHHRALRQGMPEVIFGLGKAPEHVRDIAVKLAEQTQNLLITRTSKEAAALVLEAIPDIEYHPHSGAMRLWRERTNRGRGKIAVVCAGTSDIPVAEEARITAEVMGKNWVHVQDGSGTAGEGNNDLTVTTSATVAVGNTVLVRGKLGTDKDFGYGYKYAVLVEEASVTVE